MTTKINHLMRGEVTDDYDGAGKLGILLPRMPLYVGVSEDATEARAKRVRLLSATDWTQIPDAPLTAEQSAAYAAYRQALRDVPQQAGFPGVIEWPVVP